MISKKCYYGLCAMLELARLEGSGPVPISHIAESQDIPARFLEAILRQLKQGGLANSQRGKDGGYFLARPGSEITAGEIMRLFEGPLVAFSGVNHAQQSNQIVFEELLDDARQALSDVYDRRRLSDLVRRHEELSRQYVENYSI